MTKSVAATGHRPEKIGGYDYYAPQRVWLRNRMKSELIDIMPEYTISGMALGIDQDFAQVSVELAIPFIAALPFAGQESQWPKSSQNYYNWLLKQAAEIVVVSGGGYAPYKMQVRNQWMVDNCELLFAFWDGSDGGTGNCVKYAQRSKPQAIRYFDPNDFFREVA